MPLYIGESGDLDRCHGCLTDSLTHWQTLKDRATQLLINYKSGTLVTQCLSGNRELLPNCDGVGARWAPRVSRDQLQLRLCLRCLHWQCAHYEVSWGKNILHLQPYHLFGFCLDCYIESQNSLDRSKLRPSQTPTIHPSEFFGHITFSVPNIKL